MKKLLLSFAVLTLSLSVWAQVPDSVQCIQKPLPNDPTATEVYRLENGAMVYLSVNKEEPVVVTKIVFHAGATNDPRDRTGLAHYLEHLLFKGSTQIGTVDFEKEKIILDRIEALYDERIATQDTVRRNEIYQEIDKLSSEAAKYAIPNEFIAALELLGGQSVNAYTSNDRTVYISTIPKNQMEKWIHLEHERFLQPIFRGFHTELETVYEELNMSIDKPDRRFFYFMSENVFAGHPLETPVLGKQEHLLNPSPRTVMEFYKQYYVPENMAICLSGDMDTANILKSLAQTFGKLPSHKIEPVKVSAPHPVVRESIHEISLPGREGCNIMWRLDVEPTPEFMDVMYVTSRILYNGAAGLLDQNITLPQKALNAVGGGYTMGVIPCFYVSAQAKLNDSVYALKPLLDAEIQKLKNGNFPDWLPETIYRNAKLSESQSVINNEWRVNRMMDAFIDNESWGSVVNATERVGKVTKADVIKFANTYLNDKRFVFFRTSGPMTEKPKMPKIPLTPIPMEEKGNSKFVTEWNKISVDKIQPEFPDLKKELYNKTRFLDAVGEKEDESNRYILPDFVAVPNTRDDFFTLQFKYPVGNNTDSVLSLALSYLNASGTQKRSVEQLKVDLYRLAGSVSFTTGDRETTVTITGLYDTRDSLLEIANEYFEVPRIDAKVLENLKNNILLSRRNVKENITDVLFRGLTNYVRYGRNSAYLYTLDSAELATITPEILISKIQKLRQYHAEMRYYGPFKKGALAGEKFFKPFLPTVTLEKPTPREYTPAPTDTRAVYFVDFPNSRQVHMMFLKRAEIYDPKLDMVASIFNSYYGQGMGTITFQYLRESNSLCYSCFSTYQTPAYPHHYSNYLIYLSTQASKIPATIKAIDDMGFPCIDSRIIATQNTLIQEMATARYRDWSLISLKDRIQKMNYPENINQIRWDELQKITPKDVENFYNSHVNGRPKVLLIVGDKKQIDMEFLSQLGPISEIPIDELFPK